MRVQDIMAADLVTAQRETTLKDAARILAARRISRMPVVDEAPQTVVGLFSEADVIGKERTSRIRSLAAHLTRARWDTR